MPEFLAPTQEKVLRLFKKSSLRGRFYWTGGTALAVLYLFHRYSKDLDFFSDSPFSYNQISGFVKEIKKGLNLKQIETKRIFDRYEFFLHNKDEVRLEFVFYEHPRLKPRKKWQGINVDSLDDIAANKTLALFDRNEPKDLYDVYFLLSRGGYTAKELLKLVEKKFGVVCQESGFWSEAVRMVKDLGSLRPLLLEETVAQGILKEIEDYFVTRSTSFLHRLIG